MIFLRPWFLILLIVPVLFFWMRRSGHLNTPWKKWVDARLLPYLLTPASSRRQKRSFLKLATLIWTLWVLALAGPAWEQSSPAYLNTNSTVFVLDLNSTGRGSELIKVKAKLADLLTRLADEQVALVLYDAKGYVVTPLTQDKNILRALIPTLGADVLPTAQNNPVKGFEAARRLFENLNLKTGRILFITAGGFEAAPVAKWVEQSSDQVAMLFVPTDPSDIPPDLGNIPTERLSVDDSDINTLINATPLSDLTAQKTEQSVQTQSDVGFGLVLLSIPFILYLFRKNVLFLLVIGIAGTANANFFWRPDQQAYFTAQQAANAFENKEYQKAYDLFYNPKDADALYNAAGALAYAGKIPEAIALYEQALTLAPTHQDALFNKEYLEKQLPQNNQNAATNADSNKAQNNDPSQTDSAPSNVPSSDEKKSDSPQTGTWPTRPIQAMRTQKMPKRRRPQTMPIHRNKPNSKRIRLKCNRIPHRKRMGKPLPIRKRRMMLLLTKHLPPWRPKRRPLTPAPAKPIRKPNNYLTAFRKIPPVCCAIVYINNIGGNHERPPFNPSFFDEYGCRFSGNSAYNGSNPTRSSGRGRICSIDFHLGHAVHRPAGFGRPSNRF